MSTNIENKQMMQMSEWLASESLRWLNQKLKFKALILIESIPRRGWIGVMLIKCRNIIIKNE